MPLSWLYVETQWKERHTHKELGQEGHHLWGSGISGQHLKHLHTATVLIAVYSWLAESCNNLLLFYDWSSLSGASPICTYTNRHRHTHVYIHTNNAYTQTCTHTHMRAHTHTHTHTHSHACICRHTHAHTHASSQACAHIHTHTQSNRHIDASIHTLVGFNIQDTILCAS